MMTLLLVIPFDVSAFSSAQKWWEASTVFRSSLFRFSFFPGIIMNNGGIAKKLVDFALLFVGRVPGALAHTNVLGNALFGSISSSAIAASTAIGGVLIPQQVEEGYDRKFATAVNIASAPTGMVIPPKYCFYHVFTCCWWCFDFGFIYGRVSRRGFVGTRNHASSIHRC